MAIHFHVVRLFSAFCLCGVTVEAAAPFQDGRLSQVVREVRVAEPGGPSVRAKISAMLRDGSIRTGPDSRAEISFRDQTVARLGDNTVFAFDSKSRTFDLTSGAVLTQVPSGVGATTLTVRAISATATGTTMVVECLPQSYTKFIALDGTSRLCLRKSVWGRDCVLLRAGQMLIASPDPKALPDVVDVDLGRLIDTCQFITEFPRSPGHDRLTKAAATQRKRKSHGRFADTDLVIFGRGTLVTQRNSGDATAGRGSATTPSPAAKEDPASPR